VTLLLRHADPSIAPASLSRFLVSEGDRSVRRRWLWNNGASGMSAIHGAIIVSQRFSPNAHFYYTSPRSRAGRTFAANGFIDAIPSNLTKDGTEQLRFNQANAQWL